MKAIITIINDDGTVLKANEVIDPYDRTTDYNNPGAPVTEKIVFVYKIMRLLDHDPQRKCEKE